MFLLAYYALKYNTHTILCSNEKVGMFMNNRWVKYLMAGSVTVLMVLVIIFIIRSVRRTVWRCHALIL